MPEKKIARWDAKFNIYEDLGKFTIKSVCKILVILVLYSTVSTTENSYSRDQTTMEPLRDQHEILCTPISELLRCVALGYLKAVM